MFNRSPRNKDPKTIGRDWLLRGIILLAIGAAIVISPYFIASPGFQATIGGSPLVGWFALLLGAGFIVHWWLNYRKP